MQMARWAVVGRLTASLFHEINNPMQAVRGAASLGLEELDDPEALRMYLELTLRETERVVSLIERARRIYRIEEQKPEVVTLNYVLNEVMLLTQKEMERKNVIVETELADDLPSLTAVFAELALAILCPLIQMSDAIAAIGGGAMSICTKLVHESIVIELKTRVVPIPDDGFFLILCPAIVSSYGGEVVQMQQGEDAVIQASLPVHPITRK